MILSKKLHRTLPAYPRVVQLMSSEFPPDEQLPVWFLYLMAQRKGIDFKVYYDGDNFVGFSFVTSNSNMAFLLFIAVDSEAQSKGYGSQILDSVKSDYPGKSISLDMERVSEDVANYEQRVRRLAFYQKNGFYDTGYLMAQGKDAFSILTNAAHFSVSECEKALGRLIFGIVKPKLKQANPGGSLS